MIKFIFKFFILIIAITFIIAVFMDFPSNEIQATDSEKQSTSNKKKIQEENKKVVKKKKKKIVKKKETLLIIPSVDEITGKKSYYVASESVYPLKKLTFPYSRLQSFIGFGCSSSDQNGWIYIGFTKEPNLIGGEYNQNRQIFKQRVRWGNKTAGEVTFFSSLTSAKFLRVTRKNNFIQKIMKYPTLKLELQFYQRRDIYFEYKDLRILSKAINQAKSQCRNDVSKGNRRS